MTYKNINRALGLIFFTFIGLVSCGEDENEQPKVTDEESPVITCPQDIEVNISALEIGAIVNYDKPVGLDNISATTIQMNGLGSGELFPVGTTTNTFKSIDAAGNSATCSFDVTVVRDEPDGLDGPYVFSHIAPAGKKWTSVEELTDEFDDDSFDDTKWINTDPQRWRGRPPGLFVANTVNESDGNLKLTSYKLDDPQTINGETFTHAGSNIYSTTNAMVGSYVEARMKANKTFMSSTFWLINSRGAGTGCDERVTELDIQECVGEITGTGSWTQGFDQSIHSNTHSRQTSCPETPTGSVGNDAPTSTKVYEDYHVYGCWWKSPKEIEIYLDGEKVYTIVPAADFSLPMALRLVVETYDWNPAPADGGMTGTEEERTTYYDWVRVWKLVDE